MSDVYIGDGNFRGKGLFASRNFKKGEKVISYDLLELSEDEFLNLPKTEHAFVHSFWGKRYLFRGLSKYTNHSAKPSTFQDIEIKADVAIRDIQKDEPITTNATEEIKNEIRTFIETHESTKDINDLTWSKLGYRNSACRYKVKGHNKSLTLKRINGNWQIV